MTERLEKMINNEIQNGLSKEARFIPLKVYLSQKDLVAGISYAEFGTDQYSIVAAGNDEGVNGCIVQTGLLDISNRIIKNTLGEPTSVTRDDKGIEFKFNGAIFRDIGTAGLSMMTLAPVELIGLNFAKFRPYSKQKESNERSPEEKYAPPKEIIELCREMLGCWAGARGVPGKSENSSQYAAAGREDIRKSLEALNRGRFENASPITANLWDAGYDYDSEINGYKLSSLRNISLVLTGAMKPEEFLKGVKR